MKHFRIAVLIVFAMILGSCAYNISTFVSVGTNETGFHIHYNKDGKVINPDGSLVFAENFMTIDYLKSNQVQGNRVLLSKEKVETGYMFWQYKWVTTDTVLVVNNSPSSVYYRSDIAIASKDEVGFSLPIRISASVPKEWSALYLTNFPATVDTSTDSKKLVLNTSAKAKPLDDVLNDTVKTFIIGRTAYYFKQLNFDKCRLEALSIYQKIEAETKVFCEAYGIKLVTFACEGIVPDDPSVQEALDAIGKKDILTAKANMDKDLADIDNKKKEAFATSSAIQSKTAADAKAYADNVGIREKAKADAAAAEVVRNSIETQRQLTDLRIKEKQADAMVEFAKNPDKLPDVVSVEGLKLYGLDKMVPKQE